MKIDNFFLKQKFLFKNVIKQKKKINFYKKKMKIEKFFSYTNDLKKKKIPPFGFYFLFFI
jgi:hypothetical protein